MDYESKKRKQSLKVIISESIMVLTIIGTVIVLALLVSGYWLNSDFKVERQGMVQISSAPTGADVVIDGESSWLQRTNMSKVLPSGEHSVFLSKEGYDSWSKTINIAEGLLYRLHYPRLFLKDRTKESVLDVISAKQAFISKDREKMLLYSGSENINTDIFTNPDNNTGLDLSVTLPDWSIVNLGDDKIQAQPVNYRAIYDFFKKPESTKKETLKEFNSKLATKGTEELFFSTFYDDQYLTILDGVTVTVYKKDSDEPLLTQDLTFIPETSLVGHNGEFMVFSSGNAISTLDMETMSIREWNVDGPTYGWFDDDMFYSVNEGELFVYDFDGLNRRSLAHNVSARFPVTVTRNKWLYYFSDGSLMREQIAN